MNATRLAKHGGGIAGQEPRSGYSSSAGSATTLAIHGRGIAGQESRSGYSSSAATTTATATATTLAIHGGGMAAQEPRSGYSSSAGTPERAADELEDNDFYQQALNDSQTSIMDDEQISGFRDMSVSRHSPAYLPPELLLAVFGPL